MIDLDTRYMKSISSIMTEFKMKKIHVKTAAMIAIVCTSLYLPATAGAADGAEVYKSYCSMCHDTGAAGTPKLSERRHGRNVSRREMALWKNMPSTASIKCPRAADSAHSAMKM